MKHLVDLRKEKCLAFEAGRKLGRKLAREDRSESLWEAEYKDGSVVREVSYDELNRVELKSFSLMYSTGKRMYTVALELGDVLLYRKRKSSTLLHPTLTKKEVEERLDKISQADLIYAIALKDFSLVGVEGITFGKPYKLVYIVGYIDTGLEVVHLATYSPEGEKIDSWSGSVEQMDLELRPCELMQLRSLNKDMCFRYEEIMRADPTTESVHKVEIKDT